MPLTTDPEEHALYAGVVANPLDNAPRLILADWYEENGLPERGEFIRLQMERVHLEPQLELPPERRPDRERLDAVREREQELAHLYIHNQGPWSKAEFALPVLHHSRHYIGQLWGDWFYRRGFVDQVLLSEASLAALVERICTQVPVTEFTLFDLPQLRSVSETENIKRMFYAPPYQKLFETWEGAACHWCEQVVGARKYLTLSYQWGHTGYKDRLYWHDAAGQTRAYFPSFYPQQTRD